MELPYIEPFLVSVKEVFKTMVHTHLRPGMAFIKVNETSEYDINAIIGLSGAVTGCLVLSMSEEVALKLASAFSGEDISELDEEDCIDAISEITNMIASGAKKSLPGKNILSSLPSTIIGRNKVVYPHDIPITVIPCETDLGPLKINVVIRNNRAHADDDALKPTLQAERT